jgi:hypothetical protein
MNTPIITLPGLTINISALRSLFSPDGLPQWTGKVVLTLDDSIDGMTTVVTANWAGKEASRDGMLVNFEGEAEDGECRGMLPIYRACEVFAESWSAEIAKHLGYPSAFDAHANDLADPTFAQRHEPKAA